MTAAADTEAIPCPSYLSPARDAAQLAWVAAHEALYQANRSAGDPAAIEAAVSAESAAWLVYLDTP